MSIPANMWYYKNDDKIIGPCSPLQLRQAVAAGYITAATQVRTDRDGQWHQANQIQNLLPATLSPFTDTGQAASAAALDT